MTPSDEPAGKPHLTAQLVMVDGWCLVKLCGSTQVLLNWVKELKKWTPGESFATGRVEADETTGAAGLAQGCSVRWWYSA